MFVTETGNKTHTNTMENTSDAFWSDFPSEHKLVKVANQKRSNNDIRGAIDLYVQVYNSLDKLNQIPAKRLTIQIVSKIVHAYTDLGEIAEAKRSLDKVVAVKNCLARLLFSEAQKSIVNGEISKADGLISEATELWDSKSTKQSDENSAKYLEMLCAASDVFLKNKKFKKVVQSCNKMIEHESLQLAHYEKRSEIYKKFIQLMEEDPHVKTSVSDDYHLADIVVDSSLTKNFYLYNGKKCYKDLEYALKHYLNYVPMHKERESYRIFINSGVYSWPQKSTLQAFLKQISGKKSQTESDLSLRITGSSRVIFLPNSEEKQDAIEIVEFPKGEIFFKNISFGEKKVFSAKLNKITLHIENKVNMTFDSCLFSNVKIESSKPKIKSERSSLSFDFCHFENQDLINFEFGLASWWKVSFSNCLVKNNDSTGIIAIVGCQFTLSNTEIVTDNFNCGDRLLVMGEMANLTATGCLFRAKYAVKEVKMTRFSTSTLPDKVWFETVVEKPLNDVFHKTYDLRILNGAKCSIVSSKVKWRIQVNSSDATIKQCVLSPAYATLSSKVAAVISLEKSGNMSVIGNTFEDYSLGIRMSMGAKPLIDKNTFLDGSFSAITVQQHSEPIIRRNLFKENEERGQMCAILYLPEFSSGRIEHNTFQDFSFQPIYIFQENKVDVIHNSYVNIDYMKHSVSKGIFTPKPWFMTSLQDVLMQISFKSTYDAIFHKKMDSSNLTNKIGCSMMERKWPKEDVVRFWKSDYETKRQKKIVDCQKHKNSCRRSCEDCDSEYETGSESEEEDEETARWLAEKKIDKESYLAILSGAQLKECFSCGMVKMKIQQCSHCKLVHFCDIACQRKSWPNHKALCKLITTKSTITT